MCDYLKRMSPQDTPTDDIRLWSGLAQSVVEYTGPEPFGMDGSVCLWLHERSATQLLDMCDELDAKFSELKSENAKLRDTTYAWRTVDRLSCENAKLRELCKSMRCALADFNDRVYLSALDETLIDAGFDLQELGIEVDE